MRIILLLLLLYFDRLMFVQVATCNDKIWLTMNRSFLEKDIQCCMNFDSPIYESNINSFLKS